MEAGTGKRRGRPRKVVVDAQDGPAGKVLLGIAHHEREIGGSGPRPIAKAQSPTRTGGHVLTWFEWVEQLRAIEFKYFDKRIVRASIPVRGPTSVEGLKATYALIEGDPKVWFSDGSSEIPA